MARYEDFSVGLVRIGSASSAATGNPAGSAVSANGNANSSSIIYAYLAPTITTANTELVMTSTGVQGLAVGDVVVYAPVGATPALNGANICRAYCATAGTLSVGFVSGGTVTAGTGMYRFLVFKPN
jgi:hypothetical protein